MRRAKKIGIGVCIITIITIAYTQFTSSQNSSFEPKHPGQYYADEYTPTELNDVLGNSNLIVLDVRTENEYNQGHVPGAIHIDYNNIEALTQLDPEKEIVVYCTLSSWRAPYAAYTISKSGHENVKLLLGGARNWDETIGVLESSSTDSPQIVEKPDDIVVDSPTQIDPTAYDNTQTTTYTADNLSDYNGVDGAKTYVAYDGFVYDVSESPLWVGGSHKPAVMGGYVEVKAGRDITKWLGFAPHGRENIERFPKVGIYIE